MCITTHPADLSNTKIYAGEARLGETYVHVMAYRNTAATEGPNAMILPIPAARMLGPANVIDTREFAGFLDAMLAEDRDYVRGIGDGVPESPQVFDVGSYTVVLAQRPQAIARAIEGVPANKRPSLNPALLQAFDDLYPGWPLAVCCWDGAIEAEPMLWWYEPKTPIGSLLQRSMHTTVEHPTSGPRCGWITWSASARRCGSRGSDGGMSSRRSRPTSWR